MEKKGSILIILDSEGMEVKNFLYMLSKYKGIENYEIILAYEKQEENYIKKETEELFFGVNIIYYCTKDISNRARVYNSAAEFATTPALIFIDLRIVLAENCLEEMIRSLEEDDILAVQPMVIRFHKPVVQSTGYVFSEKYFGHAFQNRNVNEIIVNKSFQRSALIGYVMAINRLVFEELHGFHTRIPYEWIGRELTMRITVRGYKNFYNHRAKAYDLRNQEGEKEYGVGFDLVSDIRKKESEKCFEEMEALLRSQIDGNGQDKKYVVLNFSGMMQVQELLGRINIRTVKVINYSPCSMNHKIYFEQVLPFALAEEMYEYIYFTNNFHQVTDNPVWFDRRNCHEDLILDLSGNVLKISEI